jgi:RHS repeat-associated protein
MKRTLLLICTFASHFLAFGQEQKRTTVVPSHPSREVKTYTAQQEFDLAKQAPKDATLNPSPLSSNFSLADRTNPSLSAEGNTSVRFKDIPVNLATGAMSLPIPIYTLSEGLLSVPITLDYNGSGMKNQDVASWAGANWSLNIGGMITRMVRGLPDEGLKSGSSNFRGYYKFGFSGNGTSVENDTEPDFFYLNINGATYKMAYRWDSEYSKFEFFPESDIKVIPTFQFLPGNTTVGKFVQFEVILPDGVHYFFGNDAIEKTVEAEAGYIQSAGNYPGTTGFTNFWNDNAQTSVWYLTKIVSPYGQEINFEYDYPIQYSYYRIADHGVDNSQTLQSVCPSPSDVVKEINRVFVSTVSLAKIIGTNTKVEINQRTKVCGFEEWGYSCEYEDQSNPRIDLETWSRYPQNSSNAKRLNEIMVMENTASPKDTLFYKFHYGHFFGANNDLPTGYSESSSSFIRVGFTHQRRLRLEKIDFPDQTNVRFRYKGDASNYNGKSRLDYGLDHWGYANGFTSNRTLTGLIPKDSDYPNCTAPTSNRESDPAFGFYGSLDSVIFANRKTVAFEYEIHTAKNYKDASGNLKPIGGARIKSILTKDLVSGIETKKAYEYTLNGQTTGHLALKPTYRYKTPFQEIGTHSSIYDRVLGEMGRPPVVYSRVTEKILNTSNQGLGKTVYHFDNDTTVLTTYEKIGINCTGQYPNEVCDSVEYVRPEKVHPAYTLGNWDHKYQTGNLIKTEIFNEVGDTLSVQSWQYTPQPIWNGRQTTAAKVFRVNNQNIGYTTCCGGVFTQNYPILFTKYRLKAQISKTFSQTGTNPITSIVNYIYKDEMPPDYQQKYPGKHNQLVKTETTDSKGNFSENYIKYTADFEFGTDTLHYEQTCTDEYGSYDCSYDEYIAHVPQVGSQARGVFEFKDAHIWSFQVETNSKLNYLHLGSAYNSIASFLKPTGGFNYAPNKVFSSGNIGGSFYDVQYNKIPNDTLIKEPSYFLNQTILSYNDFGLPTASKPFGAAQSQQSFDASKLLITNSRNNVGGVVVDSSSNVYTKKLFGVNRTIGINKMESIVVFDSTFKKGAVKQKLDKDRNILAQMDYFEPTENFSDAGLSLDNSKYRTLSRMPRIATNILPVFGDSLDVDVSYHDADGRTLQNKSLRASPTRKDLIASTPVFDSFGRSIKSILPVNANNANGSFEINVLTKAQTAYGDTQPVSEVTQFESSPLSRPFKTIGPGAAFRPSKEGIQVFETGNFNISKMIVSDVSVLNISTYSGNQIGKTTSTDENGNKTISFADKEGNTLETWVQVSGDGSQANHYLVTTYLYDYLNRPIGAVPPKLYGQIPNGTNLPSSVYINAIYLSKYDSRGRVVEKHVPDAGWTYAVYNRLGQTVLTQNARQRQTNLWEWSKYGARGQNVMSGTLTQSTYSRSQLQTLFDEFTEEKQYEERSISSANEQHTSRSFPSVIQAFIGANDIKTVNYFDDYAWNTNTQLNFQKYKSDRWPNAKGLLTGSKVRRLDTNAWLASAMYYDDKNRLIQTQSQNRFGSVNQTDIVLDFISQLMENKVIYRKPSAPTLTIATKYNYDHAGRKLDATHYFNGRQELLATYDYDELGRLVSKNLNEARIDSIKRQNPVNDTYVADAAKRFILLQPGTCISGDSVYSAFIASGLQKVSYQYDVRGNLRCVNCKTNGSLDSAKVFAMKLDYFQDGRFYNGLLSKQTWLSDSIQRSYLYSYDKANRYVTANYTGIGNEKFNENSEYDANGNILKLNRFGKTGTTSYTRIDSLNYIYLSNSNQLTGVTDLANATKGHKDNGNATDYTYYPDGSLRTDNNKGITDITYNYLGLPEEIKFGSTNKIKNLYTADGQKLAQLLIEGTDTTRTDYVGGLIYKNGDLETIWTDEGRIHLVNGTPKYQYFIQDHLGNNRVIFEKLNDSLYVAQRMDYYPFGSPFEADSLDFRFLYQGKEYVDFLGLNQFDFHSRAYDSYLGRFNQIDGANQFASGYTGMGNNPVSFIDPSGQIAFLPILAYAAIGVGVNGIINSAREKPFFQNWGGAAIAGALSGGYLSAIGAGINGHLPSYDVNLGGGFGFSISPAIAFGSNGANIGVNLGVSYSSEYFSAGVGVGLGYTNMSLGRNVAKGFTSSVAGGFSVGNENWNVGLYSSKFAGAGIGQQVAGFQASLGGVRFGYENDGAPFEKLGKFGNALNDGGDRFRTAAGFIGFGGVDIRLNMFTGDSHGEVDHSEAVKAEGYARGLKTGDGDMYRLGALSLGYKGQRIGWNSEAIRNTFQNKFAHEMVSPQEYFRRLPEGYPGNVYTSTTHFRNKYSLWTF